MKIIKKGKYTDKVYKCKVCGCEFEIDENDIKKDILRNQINGKVFYKRIIINCPECLNSILDERVDIDDTSNNN